MANCRYCQGSNEDGRCTEVRKGPEDCQGNQMVQAGGLREDATGSVGGSLGRLGGGGGGVEGGTFVAFDDGICEKYRWQAATSLA